MLGDNFFSILFSLSDWMVLIGCMPEVFEGGLARVYGLVCSWGILGKSLVPRAGVAGELTVSCWTHPSNSVFREGLG